MTILFTVFTTPNPVTQINLYRETDINCCHAGNTVSRILVCTCHHPDWTRSVYYVKFHEWHHNDFRHPLHAASDSFSSVFKISQHLDSCVYMVVDFVLITLQTFLSQLFKCLVSFRNEGEKTWIKSLRRPRRRWDNTIILSLKETGCKDVDWIELTPADSCDHGNEPSASINCDGFLN